jgi:hypothetical protein
MNLRPSYSCLSCHSVLFNRSGELMAWGENGAGSCGVGHCSKFEAPQRVLVPDGVEVAMVASGTYHLDDQRA